MSFNVPVLSGFPLEVDRDGVSLERAATIVALQNGRMLMVWTSGQLANAATYDVYARLIGADGMPEGDAFLVNEYGGSRQSDPVVAVLADGSFVIGWDSFAQFPMSGADWQNYDTGMFRHFDAQGNPLGGEQPVPLVPVMGRPLSEINAFSEGGFVATYYTWGNTLAARFFDAAGQPVSGEVALSPALVDGTTQLFTSAIALDGGHLLTWSPFEAAAGFDPASGFRNKMVFQVFDGDGTLLRSFAYKGMPYIDVVPLDSGGFLVNWGPTASAQGELVQGGMQFFNAFARPVTPRIVPDIAGLDPQVVEAVVLADGRIAVFANSRAATGDGINTFLSIYDSAGNSLNGPVALTDVLGPLGQMPEYVAMPDGNLMLLYDVSNRLLGRLLSPDGGMSEHVIDLGAVGYGFQEQLAFSTQGVMFRAVAEVRESALDGGGGLGVSRFDLVPEALTDDAFTTGSDARLLRLGGSYSAGLGDDRVQLSNQATTISGDAGNDVILGGWGNDVLYGGSGNDTLRGDLGEPESYRRNWIYGGAGDDLLIVGDNSDHSRGRITDLAYGGAGNDRMVDEGFWASDLTGRYFGGSGDDYLEVSGNKYGGDGNDTLVGRGNLVDGGAGEDIAALSFEDYDDGLPVYQPWSFDLQSATLDATTNMQIFTNIEVFRAIGTVMARMLGDAANNIFLSDLLEDLLEGRDGNDWLSSGAASDTLRGGNGHDSLFGGSGNDQLSGGFGADQIFGGSGNDVLSFADAGSGVAVDLAQGKGLSGQAFGDRYQGIEGFVGGRGNDTCTGGALAEMLDGGLGHDSLVGGAGNDTLIGGAGNDTLAGGTGVDRVLFATSQNMVVDLRGSSQKATGQGDDVLSGIEIAVTGSGNDRLFGSSANNILAGETGNDTLTGGAGADVFFFGNQSGTDVITDFTPGVDELNIFWSFVGTWTDLKLTEASGGVWISSPWDELPDGRIFLRGITLGDLGQGDFEVHQYPL